MSTTKQRPRGGCTNCGSPIHTLKDNGWVCWKCDKELGHA